MAFADLWVNLTREEGLDLAETFAVSLLKLVEDMDEVVAERDSDNDAAQELPPIMPKQVLGLRPRDFTTLLSKHRQRLAGTHIGLPEITMMENEFKSFKLAYAREPVLKAAIDSVDEDTADFDVAWKVLGTRYPGLHKFFGGLATVFPGTSSVESDFSLLKMTSDKHSTNLTDFSLESKLHAVQFFDLQKIKLD
jgi:hypothetical protein